MPKPIHADINGHHFKSIGAMARYAGVNTSTISRRIKKYGINSPKIIAKSYNHQTYYVDCKKVTSFWRLSKEIGINYHAIYDFIVVEHHEKTTLKALKAFAQRRAQYHKGHSVTINGVEYVSLKQLADKLGLAHTSMAYRWKKYQRGEISEKELMSKKHPGKNTLISKNK